LAASANFKVDTFNKNCSGLTSLLSEIPNVSYTGTLATSVKDRQANRYDSDNIENKKGFSFLTGQCKFDGNLFCFFLPMQKRRNPSHIAHIDKAPRTNAEAEALSKSAILPSLL